jgi:hypothetical protein
MANLQAQRVMGISGLLMGLAVLLTIPLYFIYTGPPPAWNVLTRALITLASLASMLVFVACFSYLVRRADVTLDWLASIVYGAGMLYVAVALVATALEAGVVFGAPDGTLDPTTDGVLAHANILIHGSIKRLLTATMLVPAGYAVLRTRMLPGWVAWSAYIIAVCNVAFVPSLFFGVDVTRFYSAHGWGNSAFVGGFLGYWTLAVGIASMTQRPLPEQEGTVAIR